jgi:hypothetical protein
VWDHDGCDTLGSALPFLLSHRVTAGSSPEQLHHYATNVYIKLPKYQHGNKTTGEKASKILAALTMLQFAMKAANNNSLL